MNNARKKMLDRIRAMLNTEGRTEAEMMAFLAKARELMATYEIDEKDLQADTEKATIHKTAVSDPYEIKRNLSVNVAKFTSCVAFRDREDVINFAGKPGDIIFATWLLDTLQRFVMRQLRDFQKEKIKKGAFHSNNLTSSSFVAGCTHRINEKLVELIPITWAKNKELIIKELNMSLTKSRKSSSNVDQNSAMAGMAAGNSARFDRPVSAGGQLKLK